MIPITDQISELKRELAMRERVYPEWVQRGKIKRSDANAQYLRMKAALQTLVRIEEQNSGKQTEMSL